MDMKIDRRSFLVTGTSAFASTALSYSRIPGANDRISLGHIGIGSRGRGLASIAAKLKDGKNVEMTAVCDLWKVNREKAAATAEKAYGRSPRPFHHIDHLPAMHALDPRVISPP